MKFKVIALLSVTPLIGIDFDPLRLMVDLHIRRGGLIRVHY